MEPIFIIANPRSGSSAFRLILNSTSESVFPPECGFIQWLYSDYKEWDINNLREFTVDVLNSKRMDGWGLKFEGLYEFLENNAPTSYGEACSLVYKYFGKCSGKNAKVWGDKNNYYINHLRTINEIFPKSKFIWLKRNPKDICASYLNLESIPKEIKNKPNLPSQIELIFNEIYQNYKEVSTFFQSIIDERYFILNFEDVLLKDSLVLKNLEEFTGIQIELAISNFDENIYFDEPNSTMAWKEKTKHKLDSSHIDTYKKHPMYQEIERCFSEIDWLAV